MNRPKTKRKELCQLLEDFQEHDTKTIQYEYVYEKKFLEWIDNTKEIVKKELNQNIRWLKSDERSS